MKPATPVCAFLIGSLPRWAAIYQTRPSASRSAVISGDDYSPRRESHRGAGRRGRLRLSSAVRLRVGAGMAPSPPYPAGAVWREIRAGDDLYGGTAAPLQVARGTHPRPLRRHHEPPMSRRRSRLPPACCSSRRPHPRCASPLDALPPRPAAGVSRVDNCSLSCLNTPRARRQLCDPFGTKALCGHTRRQRGSGGHGRSGAPREIAFLPNPKTSLAPGSQLAPVAGIKTLALRIERSALGATGGRALAGHPLIRQVSSGLPGLLEGVHARQARGRGRW